MTVIKILTSICMILAFWLGWVIYDFNKLASQYRTVSDQLSIQKLVLSNTFRILVISNEISQLNLVQREEMAANAKETQDKVKVIYVKDACANTLQPADSIKRLREYEKSIHSNSFYSDPRTSIK